MTLEATMAQFVRNYDEMAKQLVEVRRREPDGSWTVLEARPGLTVAMTSIGCALAVDEVYRNELAPS